MKDVEYEKFVDRLAQRVENQILSIAIAAVEAVEANGGDGDYARDEAKNAVEVYLFGCPAFERVEAVDISDLAYDTAERAWSQTRAWSEEGA